MKTYNRIAGILFFLVIPLMIRMLGDAPRRNILKEVISILTIVAYFLMLGQFYLTRANIKILKPHKTGKVVNLHKVIGYVFVSILLFHPFLIILPRFFEAGITPGAAFTTMITTRDSQGLILGLIAWCLMLVLGITSVFRNKLGLNYTSWRLFHGVLSIAFIFLASWHAMDLGRHTDLPMSLYMGTLACIGILLLLNTYILKPKKTQTHNN